MTRYLQAEVSQRNETQGGGRMMETSTPSSAKQRERGWAAKVMGKGGKEMHNKYGLSVLQIRVSQVIRVVTKE